MSKIKIREHPRYYNVYISGNIAKPKLFTKNLVPGKSIYGEKRILFHGIEYRKWNPYRSKLAALLLKNPEINPFKEGQHCLYLGASTGTTISHLSDILLEGIIYGVEFAERSMRQLIQNIKKRKNIIPILGDARYPEEYARNIFSEVDLIYQDVAQPNQAEIAIVNSNYYLKNDGIIIMAVKSQSIDSITKPEKVFANEKKKLENEGFKIIESVNIHDYAANHVIFVIKRNQ
ncbi:MAG: fibrillarin-like rRNA/tRNA 2'-O-methyltransferase [Promethearchaeota archaeon]